MFTFTIQNSAYFAQPFVQYAPLTAGFGFEPSTTICSMIRNSLLSAPMSWFFNRNEITFPTVVGQQDYLQSISANGNDFGFIEKATLTDDQGNIIEIKDVYNTAPLAVSAFKQQPSAIAAQQITYSGVTQSVKFRFLGVPNQIYTVTVTYQKLAPQFGPFSISASSAASGGNTTYTGTFDPYSLPTGAIATIAGFVSPNTANNGSFTIVSCNATTLVVANTAGTAVSGITAFALNLSWSPIPNQFSDIYNNLYLSEVLSVHDDARAQLYRQRGVAAFLAKSSGLTETQKNAFVQQWIARGSERASAAQAIQRGDLGRSV
jgi:hypothetical protein